MITSLLNKISKAEQQVSTKPFAWFRITFSLFVLLLIADMAHYRFLVFEAVPHISFNPFPVQLFLFIWSVVALLLLTGAFTRLAAVVHYALMVFITFYFRNTGVASFNDDLLKIGSLLLIFMPVHHNYSVDAFIHILKFGKRPSNKTSSLYYLASAVVSIGLLYWASSITKFMSPMWLKGLGLWIPSTMPYNKWHGISNYLDMQWLMYGLNYLTMAWELFFAFAIFFSQLRKWIAIIGIGFHLGIALIFPFPLFCLGPLPFYFLILFNSKKSKSNSIPIQVGYDPNNKYHTYYVRLMLALNANIEVHKLQTDQLMLNQKEASYVAILQTCTLGKIIARLLQFEFIKLLVWYIIYNWFNNNPEPSEPRKLLSAPFKRGLLTVFCLMLISVQAFYTIYHINSRIKAGPSRKEVFKFYKEPKGIIDVSLKPSNMFRTLFGLNARGVFLDHSNTGMKNVFAIVRISPKDTFWLPYFNQDGYAQNDNMNMAWSRYSFNNVCKGPLPLPKEIHKVLWVWMEHHQQSTKQVEFTILRRTYFFPTEFKKGYHQQLIQQPWESVAKAGWRNHKFYYHLSDSTLSTPKK
jgi:uncharacterized membrane protein YphA (DoxX/SURF4 family)